MFLFGNILEWIQEQDPEVVKAWGPIFIGTLTVLISLITVIWSQISNRKLIKVQNVYNERQLALSKSKEERDEILMRLNKFYGPFIELRTESKLIYDKFESELDQKYRSEGRRFRTLRHLLEGKEFNSQEKQLLEQILSINKELIKLIESSSGIVDRPELQDLLGRLGAHIRILQLAYDRKIQGPPGLFEDIVFPLAIDGAIESAIRRIKDRLKELADSIEGRPISKNIIIKTPTIEYYNRNAEVYAKKTLFLDLSELYEFFRAALNRGGRILDAGCGAGRDTRYFIERGYRVLSFDASEGMVEKCHEYPHAYCLHMTFDDVNFTEEFDGVWCCASLIHLTQAEGKLAVKRLTTSLKGGGVMFISVKMGKGNAVENGRFFQYYDESSVKGLYQDEYRLEESKLWKSKSKLATDSAQDEWLNLLLKKKPNPF